MSGLEALAGVLRDEGGALAAGLREPPAGGDPTWTPGADAAGPRAAADPAAYELVLEAVREGYLLHYAAGRILAIDDDDLALLAGDRLYALGLDRLVALGDVDAVAELADVIGLSAMARAGGDDELAEAVWAAGAHAVGWGSSAAHGRAKQLAGTGDPGAASALLAAAEEGRPGPPPSAGR